MRALEAERLRACRIAVAGTGKPIGDRYSERASELGVIIEDCRRQFEPFYIEKL